MLESMIQGDIPEHVGAKCGKQSFVMCLGKIIRSKNNATIFQVSEEKKEELSLADVVTKAFDGMKMTTRLEEGKEMFSEHVLLLDSNTNKWTSLEKMYRRIM